MNEAQQKILAEVGEKLGEHFDGFVLVTRSENEDRTSSRHVTYDGGFHAALGLLTITQQELIGRFARPAGEDEP